MTCLSIVQSAFRRVGLSPPTAAVTSSDDKVLQMLEFANEAGKDLVSRFNWTTTQKEYSFTTLAQEIQIPNLAFSLILPGWPITPSGIDVSGIQGLIIHNNTMWNRTRRLPVFGPLSQQQWQQQKAMVMQGPWNQYRIAGNQLRFLPAPAAGDTVAFEYKLRAWVWQATLIASIGSNATIPFSDHFTADADTCVFDEELIVKGMKWRWKESKGLPYAQAFDDYESSIADTYAQDGTKPILSMNGGYTGIDPIVIVPAGSWTP